jgi:voltage-gated potassium channel
MTKNSNEKNLRERIHEIIFGTDTFLGAAFDVLLLIAIVLSIVVISMESVEGIGWRSGVVNGENVKLFGQGNAGTILHTAKWFFTILFTLEYVMRIYCVKRPMKYVTSFWGIIDLLSFLPDYILMLGASSFGFGVIRSLRLVRVFRIFKLGWFQFEAEDLSNAIWRARAKIIVFLTVVMILVTVTGTLMFEIENALMKDESLFKSIPDGIYWAIVTMTTVGFGDIVPKTVPGKFLSAFLILVGYSLIIVPTGFVTAEVLDSKRRKQRGILSCSSCLKEGHDKDAAYCKHCGEII